jgi:hypothetical protein
MNASASNDAAPPLGRVVADGSRDWIASPEQNGALERRLMELEDQVAQLREEVRRLRREP